MFILPNNKMVPPQEMGLLLDTFLQTENLKEIYRDGETDANETSSSC